MSTAISVKDLTRTFKTKRKESGLRGSLQAFIHPNYTEVQAVRQVNFAIQEGERIAFIGPNGAGKSTTIKILVGILTPSSGQAQVLGLVPWQQRKQLAYQTGVLFGQKSQLLYHLPPQDSFDLLAQIFKLSSNQYQERLRQLIRLFEIEPFLRTPVRKLSLGQRMRCEIVASLIHRPKLLLLDEPTIGLDVVVKQQVRDLILYLSREEGVTIMLASHDTRDVEVLCDRAIVINSGLLVFDGTLDELKERHINSRIISLKLAEPFAHPQIPGVQVVSQDDYSVVLEVNLAFQTIEFVISSLLEHCKIIDVVIGVPPMEEIIRDIYQVQVME